MCTASDASLSQNFEVASFLFARKSLLKLKALKSSPAVNCFSVLCVSVAWASQSDLVLVIFVCCCFTPHIESFVPADAGDGAIHRDRYANFYLFKLLYGLQFTFRILTCPSLFLLSKGIYRL